MYKSLITIRCWQLYLNAGEWPQAINYLEKAVSVEPYRINLNEERKESLPIADQRSVSLPIDGRKLATLEVVFD